MSDGKLSDEVARLAALRRYQVLDTAPEAPFDRVTALVRTVLRVPMAAVSLIDTDRQWFKSSQGLYPVCETARDISFCGHTIQTDQPLVIPDALADPRFMDNPLVTGEPRIAAYMGVPLRTPDGYNVGSLCAIDTVARAFDAGQIEIMKSFAAVVVSELELRLIALRDHLTGAATRRGFEASMHEALARRERLGRTSSLIMLDIDHFKRVNDAHGHAAGDDVLRAVAVACMATLRPGDAFGRLGGEEFAVLLAATDATEAMATAERLRSAVAGIVVDHDPPLRVTASFGVAEMTAGITVDGWLAQADAGLYAAKQSGRNRCVLRG